jgi:hypothetical protein
MENKQRKYFNRSSLVTAARGEVGEAKHKVLKLRFRTFDREAKEQVDKWFTMFLTQENNERNQETLRTLGVQSPPAVVSYDNVETLPGLGNNVVDLVAEVNEAGYENTKYINPPKFDMKVFTDS